MKPNTNNIKLIERGLKVLNEINNSSDFKIHNQNTLKYFLQDMNKEIKHVHSTIQKETQ